VSELVNPTPPVPATASIQIEVNGEPRSARAGLTVRGLLAELSLKPEPLAVEINRALLPRARFDQPLAHGDRVEIVTFVGGG